MKPTKQAPRYGVHKIFGPTIQGEGGMTGTVCHFLRLSGCNMWDGRPETRADSLCPFCDTDFYSRTMMTSDDIVAELQSLGAVEWITISGGEPALQLLKKPALVEDLNRCGYKTAVETNGTVKPGRWSELIDHVTLSPKVPPEELALTACDTLKVLWPHPDPRINPLAYAPVTARQRFVQPITGDDPKQTTANMRSAIDWVTHNTEWRLSPQVHKLIGVE
jgi:7-carboxy-7-deazaguanine synthase